jgi:hypothetical protein
MAAMVSVQAVRGNRRLVAELGDSPVRLLRAAKIKSTAFGQPASSSASERSVNSWIACATPRDGLYRSGSADGFDDPDVALRPAV